jgi:ABC-type ATPase involved in cell division
MAEIRLERVTKRYPDGTEGVKTLDLDVGDGEFMILVGPSGRRAVGLWEVHCAADGRRAGGHQRG